MTVTVSMGLVVLSGLGVLGLGFWLSRPVPVLGRWLVRGVLACVLVALLAPAGVIDSVQDWVTAWLPAAASASRASGADWAVHFLSFAGLGALLFHVRQDVPTVWMGAGLIVLGGLTELLQVFVDGRQAAASDLAADSLGVAIGYLAALGLGRRLTAPD